MLTTPVRFSVDLSEATTTETLPNILIAGDANAYEIIVDVYRDDVAVDLTGSTVYGIGLLPGNISVFATGSASGNTARFTMTDEFHAKKGTMYVLMTIVQDGVQYTVFRGVCQVLKSAQDTNAVLNTTFPVSDLIAAAQNESERKAAEIVRQQEHETMKAICDAAKAVIDANIASAEEDEEGYVNMHFGVEYNAYNADLQIQQSINTLSGNYNSYKTTNDANIASILSKNTAQDTEINKKLDMYQGVQNMGEFLVVGDDGNVALSDIKYEKTKAIEHIPIGMIVSLSNEDTPSSLFGGGVWESIDEGKFLMSAGTNTQAGTTGGSSSYTPPSGGSSDTPSTPSDTTLKINLNPSNASARIGDTVTMTADATNAQTYVWQYSTDSSTWNNVTFSTSGNPKILMFVLTTTNASYIYRCKITGVNADIKYTSSATVTKIEDSTDPNPSQTATVLVEQQDINAVVGQTVTLSFGISGANAFQWQSSSDNGSTWNDISGQTMPDITLTVSSATFNTKYRIKYTYGDNNTAGYTRTVSVANNDASDAIVITSQPQDVNDSETCTVSVTATGATGYEWQVKTSSGNWSTYNDQGNNYITLWVTESTNNVFRCRLYNATNSLYTRQVSVKYSSGDASKFDLTTSPYTSFVFAVGSANTITASVTNGTKYEWYKYKGNTGVLLGTTTSNSFSWTPSSMEDIYGCKIKCVATVSGNSVNSKEYSTWVYGSSMMYSRTCSDPTDIVMNGYNVTTELELNNSYTMTAEAYDTIGRVVKHKWMFSTDGSYWSDVDAYTSDKFTFITTNNTMTSVDTGGDKAKMTITIGDEWETELDGCYFKCVYIVFGSYNSGNFNSTPTFTFTRKE